MDAIVLYGAPILALAGVALPLFASLAPVILFKGQLSLFTVTPKGTQNGASIFVGALGSCSRARSGADLDCTGASFSPKYDLSAFPNSAPLVVISPPPAAVPIFVAISLVCTFVFLITFTLLSLRRHLPDLAKSLSKPSFLQFNACIGFFGWFIGLITFLIMRLWFGKATTDFNRSIGNNGQFVASDSNAFIMAWFAYGFLGIPVILSLLKKGGAAGGKKPSRAAKAGRVRK
ncbi:hypothetical protein L218DRAFT_110409 [Marasmius fiardii PR-910]|nr:hypothetical protein L218DRAFT_110409 [Marasmius fiardii PR-910]